MRSALEELDGHLRVLAQTSTRIDEATSVIQNDIILIRKTILLKAMLSIVVKGLVIEWPWVLTFNPGARY